MVKLRLKRAGKKRAAFYRIVASDSRVKRDGEYIELVGTYNPINGEVNVDKEIALKWLKQGAQPTDTVRNILSGQGVMTDLHNAKLEAKKAAPKAEKAAKKPAAKKPTVPKAEATPKAAKPAAAKAEAKPAAAKPAAEKKAPAAKPAAATKEAE